MATMVMNEVLDLALRHYAGGRWHETEALWPLLQAHDREGCRRTDAPRSARKVEAAYRNVWRRWCASPDAA
jgi:hypothetical protein